MPESLLLGVLEAERVQHSRTACQTQTSVSHPETEPADANQN